MRPQAKHLSICLVLWIIVLVAIVAFMEEADSKREYWPLERKFWDMGYAEEPRVILSDDVIHIAYIDRSPYREERQCEVKSRVVYVRSDDWGRSWDSRVLYETCGQMRDVLAMASSEDSVYVVWSDWGYYSESEVVVSVSHDQGRSWRSPNTLANHALDVSSWLNIVAEGDFAYVTYHGGGGLGSIHMNVVGSDDCGLHWGEERRVPFVDGFPRYGSAISNGTLYIAITLPSFYAPGQPYLYQTSDFGQSWDIAKIDLVADIGPIISSAQINEGEIGILSDVGYLESPLDDFNWTDPNEDVSCCMLLESGGTLHAFELNYSSGLYRQSSFDAGHNWTTPAMILEKTDRGPRDYDADVQGGNIAVVWTERKSGDQSENEEVYLIMSNDKGITWNVPQRITDNTNELAIPLFALVVALLMFMTLVLMWFLKELIHARRKLPINF